MERLGVQYQRKIEQLDKECVALNDGAAGQPGIRQLRTDLYKMLADRRRVWRNCDPSVKLGQDTAEITVTINQTAPLGIAAGTVLYAFDAADATDAKHKGLYLGEFTVTNVADKEKQAALEVADRQAESIR